MSKNSYSNSNFTEDDGKNIIKTFTTCEQGAAETEKRKEKMTNTKLLSMTLVLLLIVSIVSIVSLFLNLVTFLHSNKAHTVPVDDPEEPVMLSSQNYGKPPMDVNSFSVDSASVESLPFQAKAYEPMQSTFSFRTSTMKCSAISPNVGLGSYQNPGTSCLNLKLRGTTDDGLYYIQQSKVLHPYLVYCDMSTSEGGWTLVATINENNINSKCGSGDVWFNYETSTSSNKYDYRNWENKNTFGRIETANTANYKNEGYFSIEASDVMVRHVPLSTEVTSSNGSATLEYHTTNSFLRNYGGNLYNLFNNYYPLNPTEEYYLSTDDIVDALSARDWEIAQQISNFYFYDYGTDSNQMYDSNLFTSYGLYMYSYDYSCGRTHYYGDPYRCSGSNDMVSNAKSHPFTFVMSIGNYDERYSKAYIRVNSYRPSTETKQKYTATLNRGNFQLTYEAYCRYGGSLAASLCDVGYLISNQQEWRSSETATLYLSETTYSSYYYVYMYAQNNPSNVLLGYTMLSRSNGQLISSSQMSNAMAKILQIVADYSDIDPDCRTSSVGISPPVQFTYGYSSLESRIPPSVPGVETGYIQFRSRGQSGSVYAMCPAVRADNCLGEYLCVGGVKSSSSASSSDDCNNFLNWDGYSSVHQDHAYGYAHSREDIESSLMLFYR